MLLLFSLPSLQGRLNLSEALCGCSDLDLRIIFLIAIFIVLNFVDIQFRVQKVYFGVKVVYALIVFVVFRGDNFDVRSDFNHFL